MSRRPSIALPLLLTTLLFAVAPASAQIGGLVRRAARTAITDPKSTSEAAAPRIKPEEQLTAEHLDAFEKGLDAEEGVRKEAARQAAKMKTKQEYQSCVMTMVQSADYSKLTTAYGDEMQKAAGNTDETVRASERYTERLKALSESKCGPNPDEQSSYAAKTAAAAETSGAKAAGVTATLYGQWKERVVPFCNLPASKRGTGVVRAEGYAYLENESAALAPRCAALMPKIKLGT